MEGDPLLNLKFEVTTNNKTAWFDVATQALKANLTLQEMELVFENQDKLEALIKKIIHE